MMTPGSANALLLADAGYQIQRSVRTRGAYPATPSYFSRTAGTPTNNLKWTFSGWLKQGVLSVGQHILTAGTGTSASEDYLCFFASQNRLGFVQDNASSTYLTTAQLFRDPSAWYHILFVYDSAQATASDRAIFYVNGVRVTALNAATYPTLNQASKINSSGLLHRISSRTYLADEGFDGYLTDINFIDGQALTPASFGEINPVTGVWSAKKYAGTYGTNGFYLNFSDNSAATAAAIGKDSSGNGNNWTPTGISVTAGVTYDSMLDVPLGAGGAERGNYAVLNPLYQSSIPVGGNLNIVGDSNSRTVAGTMSASTGKWYAEGVFTSGFATNGWFFVWDTSTPYVPGNVPATTGQTGAYYAGITGNIAKAITGTVTTIGTYSTWTNNDIIGMAFDADTGTISFYKNNALQTTITDSGLIGRPLTFGIYYYAGSASINFGQRPFAYTPPTGFKALHTGNLPDAVIKQGASYMAATTYTGNGATQSISNAVNGVGFQPDLVWMKARSAANSHYLSNSVMGVGFGLISDSTAAQATVAAGKDLTSFDATGFSLGPEQTFGSSNTSGTSIVAWQWKANGAAVSNTAGSITSQVSAGVSQGFSVVTWTGTTASSATIGHGLGVAPSMVIVKNRSRASTLWCVYTPTTGNTKALNLNDTSTGITDIGFWNNTNPTSTVFTTGNGYAYYVGGIADNYVAYCFSEVAGYSAFGSYTGNGSADGPFVFLGFRPRFVMVKRTDTTGNWEMHDTSRATYNADAPRLWANLSSAEDATEARIDELSNGFKLRSGAGDINVSGGTYIFAAFAEAPFKNSLAR
jgi:hypothetical protein